MEGIILKRTQTNDASLILKVLQENGMLQSFKIPGILKSSKRSAYFISPASIWNFTVMGNYKDIVIPKEYSLVFSPVDFNTSYPELVMINEAMKPLNKLRPEFNSNQLYPETRNMILKWETGKSWLQNSLLNYYYLMFIKHMGLFHFSAVCIHCGHPLSESDKYHLYSGSACLNCLSNQVYREEETLPNHWVLSNFKNNSDENSTKTNADSDYRERILKFIDHTL